jgi:uncharacterized protein (DUF2141 family)
MKSLLIPALLVAAATAQAQTCAQVEVTNVRPQQGHLMLVAYGDAETYNKKPLTALRLQAGEATMSFQVCGLSGGQVALSLFQDLDSDGKMGRNVLGIPTEPWGSSGTPGAFGPSWETGRVALDGKTIAVRLSQ